MISNILGAALLVISTCIGGAILALPIALNNIGFYPAVYLLIFSSVIMSFGAYLILELSYKQSPKGDFFSLMSASLPNKIAFFSGGIYFLLLFTMLIAYTSAIYDMICVTFKYENLAMAFFCLVYFFVLMYGFKVLDIINRPLIILKLILFAVMAYTLCRQANFEHLTFANSSLVYSVSTFVVTSFGYAIIFPALRARLSRFESLVACIIGAFLPLAIYLIWTFAVLSNLSHGIIAMALQNDHGVAKVVDLLSGIGQNSTLVWVFYFLCIFTSILAVGFTSKRFVQDVTKNFALDNRLLSALVVLLPLICAIVFPNAFLLGFKCAGIWCWYLLIALPIYMAYKQGLKISKSILLVMFILSWFFLIP